MKKLIFGIALFTSALGFSSEFSCTSYLPGDNNWVEVGVTVNNNDILVSGNPDKAIIQTSMSYYPDLVYADSCGEDYLWDNRSWVMAGLWGGYKEPMLKFAELIHDVFENKMVGNNLVNNEQIAMAYVYKNNPELFLPFENHANMHKDYEFIQELGFVE